jgi:hypothetical protein
MKEFIKIFLTLFCGLIFLAMPAIVFAITENSLWLLTYFIAIPAAGAYLICNS